MKTTIVYLGILSTMFINMTSANIVAKEQQNYETEIANSAIVQILKSDLAFENNSVTIKKPTINIDAEISVMDSLAKIMVVPDSIEASIEEDKKITESQEVLFQPIYFDRTVDEIINEDNQIIESDVINEVYILDFELINKMDSTSKNERNINTFLERDTLKS